MDTLIDVKKAFLIIHLKMFQSLKFLRITKKLFKAAPGRGTPTIVPGATPRRYGGIIQGRAQQ